MDGMSLREARTRVIGRGLRARDGLSHLFRTPEAGPLRTLNIEMTILCNLRCPMCWWYGTNGVAPTLIRNGDPLWSKQLTKDEIFRILDGVRGEVEHLHLSGAETFARADTIEVLEYASRLGMTCSFTTNGTLLDSRPGWLERIAAARVRTIVVSIDGPEDVHDAIRGQGMFRKTTETIRRLIALRGDRTTPLFAVNSTVTSGILGRMNEVVETARSVGFDEVRFQHLWFADPATALVHAQALKADFGIEDHGADAHVMPVPGAEYGRRVARELREVQRRNFPYRVDVRPNLNEEQAARYYSDLNYSVVGHCSRPWGNPTIKASGEVVFCPDQWISYSIGNVRDAPIEQLWNGDRARTFREKLDARGLYPGCVRCCAINVDFRG